MATVEDDLSGLPEELLKELSAGVKGDTLIQIIDARGGIASLDQILIDMYRFHNRIGKRSVIANRLYRLRLRDLVWPVSGRKGVYSTWPNAESSK